MYYHFGEQIQQIHSLGWSTMEALMVYYEKEKEHTHGFFIWGKYTTKYQKKSLGESWQKKAYLSSISI